MMKSPFEHLGFNVGDDYKLADWSQIVAYFEQLNASDRMELRDFGMSTEGRRMIYAIITHPDHLKNIDKYREIQARLADPRGLSEEEAEKLITDGKSIVLITCSVHATEVGGAQMSMELAHDLLTRNDADVMEILNNNIFIFVPSLNPDGLDIVVNWYKDSLGKPHEGLMPPVLYQKYTGHDNNRDWFMLTQKENYNAIINIQNVWHPHIVHDQHQMGSDGYRFILPPFIDPYDSNVDPILQQQVNTLGTYMASALTTNGKKGVAFSVGFDAFSPSRAYQHYHGGVRILSEAASVKIASPINVKFSDITGYGGGDAKASTYNHPEPWEGGDWKLRDIIEYDKTVAFACLQHAAKFRKDWVRNFYRIHQRAVQPKSKPYAFVIPNRQRDPYSAAEMMQVMDYGMVEIKQAQNDFKADGYQYHAGDFIIEVSQPYGSYAKTMLEKQVYPDLRLYPGGPPKRPYDVTAQTLGLQMGVTCQQIDQPFEVQADLVKEVNDQLFSSAYCSTDQGPWSYILPESNRAFKIVNELLAAGETVYRLSQETGAYPAGTFVVKDKQIEVIEGITGHMQPHYGSLLMMAKMPKIGLYKSYVPGADEGWTRFILENYQFNFENFSNHQITKEHLAQYDAIILPQNRMPYMETGLPGVYPPENQGGLGDNEMAVLLDYAKNGGTILAFDNVCELAIDKFYLPVRNVVKGLPGEDFFIPGSFLRTVLDTNHPLAWGMERETSILFLRSPAFEVKGPEATVVGRYPGQSALLSGWVLGEQHLHLRGNLVDVKVGKGNVVLYGMRPQFRAQARGTYKLVFNALNNAVLK